MSPLTVSSDISPPSASAAAADAVDLGLARRAGDDDIAADAVDAQLARGHAADVDIGRDRVDLQLHPQRHGHAQFGRFALVAAGEQAHAAAAIGVTHLDRQVLAVAFDLELFHAFAERAFDLDLGPVPGADLDQALDVVDLDAAERIDRAALIDRGRGEHRQRGGQAECEQAERGQTPENASGGAGACVGHRGVLLDQV
ncbi:MAG: hypothetical protein JF591_13710 [Lysobacter sp.]|nr:hypothetical protein [Lysobacter sp.]